MTKNLRYNADAEASILGGILLRNEILAQLDTLETDDFCHYPHKIVFEAIRNLEVAHKPIDVVMLETEIERQGKLDAIGGVSFLGELAMRVPTIDNVLAYAEIVREHALARRIMLYASDLAQRAQDADADPTELLGEALSGLARLDRSQPDTTSTIGQLAKRRFGELEEIIAARARGEARITGVPTGIIGLDRRLGGYQFGIVNLLAARPAMGKSAMAMACIDAATAAGYPAHVFSLEDSWRAYADRSLSRGSGVSVERLRQGDLDRDAAQRAIQAMGALSKRSNWLLDDRAAISASEIVRAVRRRRAQHGTRIVVVDYIQLVRRAKGLNENDALYEIMVTFAQAAKADDIAYLVVSQLNRDVEKRIDKRPQLSDLRGSGALEEQSKIIVSPYRGAYYSDKPKRGVDYDCDCPETASICSHRPSAEAFEKLVQVLVLKNNNGQTGRVFASWRGETTEMW